MATMDKVTTQEEATPLLAAPVDPERRWRWVFPEIPTFFYFMALVTQFPVQQFWLVDYFSRKFDLNSTQHDACGGTNSTSAYSDVENRVQSMTALYLMFTGLVCNVVAIFPTLFLGSLTDKFGRRFVFFFSFVLLMLNEVVLFCVFYFKRSPNYLLVSSFILGVSGSFGLYLTAAFSMVADISSTQRSLRVATLEMAIALGFSIGLGLAGVWVKTLGYVWPMGIAMGLAVTAFLYFWLFIPETYTDRPQHTSCFANLSKSYKLFLSNTVSGRRGKLNLCLVTFLIYCWCQGGEGSFVTLYLLHQPFCWHKMSITLFNGGYTLTKWVLILLLVNVLRGRVPESVFALIGMISAATSYLLKGLANTDLIFIVGTGTGLLTDIVSPMCRSMMSKEASADEQGALFAGIGVLQMIVSATSGVAMVYVYKAGLGYFLGLPYMVLTAFALLSVGMLVWLLIHLKRYPGEIVSLPVTEEEGIIN